MQYTYTSEELNNMSVVDLINFGVIASVIAGEYDPKINMTPIQFFTMKGMIQTVPLNYFRLISDAKLVKNMSDRIAFCMKNTNGNCNPCMIRDMLTGRTCFKCLKKQINSPSCPNCKTVLND